MKEELRLRNINFVSEHKIPFNLQEQNNGVWFRCDLLVENLIVIEFKAVTEMNPFLMLMNHMKLLNSKKVSYLIVLIYFKEGQKPCQWIL
jgi:GxxExxY protein